MSHTQGAPGSSLRSSRESYRAIFDLDAEKAAAIGMVALIAYGAVRSAFYAASRPFWYDEVCTWAMARLPNVSTLWAALAQAADGNPPGFYLIEHHMARAVALPEIAFRIPSIIGFCCTLWCLFLFVRKRSGGLCALVCSGALTTTLLFDYRATADVTLSPFAVEARPYSLVLACISIALVCYQRAPKASWMLLMGLSLALAETLHYYAVFALAPFALAEAARFLKTRQMRPGIWVALTAGVLPLAAFWPLLWDFRKFMGTDFWAVPTFLGAVKAYSGLLQLPIGLGLALAALIGIVMLKLSISRPDESRRNDLDTSHSEETPFHEYILVLGLLCLPFIAFAAAKIAHAGMTTRYVLSTMLAFPMAAGYILPRLSRALFASTVLLVALSLTYQEAYFWRHWTPLKSNPGTIAASLINQVGYPELPVVIDPPIASLAVAYYAPNDLKPRLSVVVDRGGLDSVETQLFPLHAYIPIQIREFSSLTSDHSRFLLYNIDSWGMLNQLVSRGYMVRCLKSAPGPRAVYLVESPSGTR